MRLSLAEAPSVESLKFIGEQGGLTLRWTSEGGELEVDALAFAVEFERVTLRPGLVLDSVEGEVSGRMDCGDIGFTVRWSIDGAVLRKQVTLIGSPDANWGSLLRLVVHQGPIWGETGEQIDATMGWRDGAFTPGIAESRKPEEGAGRQPACGYPIFLQRGFIGLEHPMGFNDWMPASASVRIYHHPTWADGELTSETMVLGRAVEGTSVREAFMDYFATIRKPLPSQVAVEINTFWTDPVKIEVGGGVSYCVDLPSYRALAEQWINGVFEGEQGLISALVLDAGWSDRASIYRPKESVGGEGDEALAAFAQELDSLGMSLGLWISTNGPIGVDVNWARAEGYALSNYGVGAGYSAGAKTQFICLDDQRWEADFQARVAELNTNVTVGSYKCDWDNEGIISARQRLYPLVETAWEENVNAMIRMFGAIAPRRVDGLPGTRVRGAWWLSPWWFQHVDSAHLPHSGDLEHCSLPALTPREASLNSRDMLLYEHLVLHRTPIPWDVIDSHDFAHAPRCPVLDSDESWLHTLILWVMRGAQAIQLYVPPYGVRGWRAQVLRQTLRWFRDHEAFLSNARHEWVGGNPGMGDVYGFHHLLGDEELLLLRNPVGSPQSLNGVLPAALRLSIENEKWSQIYPHRGKAALPRSIGSNEILIFQRGEAITPFPPARMRIPEIHQIGEPTLSILSRSDVGEHWKIQIPYQYDQAELVMEWESDEAVGSLQVAAGRYEDGVSSAILPVTWLLPHWRSSYTEARSRLSPKRWGRVVARMPLPTAGTAYLTIRSPFPKPLAVWVEAGLPNPADGVGSRALPLPQQARRVVVHAHVREVTFPQAYDPRGSVFPDLLNTDAPGRSSPYV